MVVDEKTKGIIMGNELRKETWGDEDEMALRPNNDTWTVRCDGRVCNSVVVCGNVSTRPGDEKEGQGGRNFEFVCFCFCFFK